MIVYKITERVKPQVYPTTNWVSPVIPNSSPILDTGKLYQEIRRRDGIIKALVKEFKHAVGAEVEPKDPIALEKWGKCTIMGICQEYVHLEKDFKWPKNDNPMIVTASSEQGEIFYATTNYFK